MLCCPVCVRARTCVCVLQASLQHLREVRLEDNGLKSLCNLPPLPKLLSLHLATNRIADIAGADPPHPPLPSPFPHARPSLPRGQPLSSPISGPGPVPPPDRSPVHAAPVRAARQSWSG